MPSFVPFRGLRFSAGAGVTADLVSPPYDVFDEAERARIADRSPHNIVHVDYPLESDGPDRYRSAALTLEKWRANGSLVLDERAGFYLYRMDFADELRRPRSTVGVVGGLGLADVDVLPHEQTTPKAKSDRLDLLVATGVNLSPIWGLSLAAGLTALLEPPGDPLVDVLDSLGVRHRLEVVVDSGRVEAISSAMSDAPVLIADGHHRFAVSRAYLQGPGAGHPGSSHAMAYVAELAESQLSIEAIHRLVSGVDHRQLLELLTRHYETIEEVQVGPETLALMRRTGSICLVRPGGTGVMLSLRPGALAGTRAIDSARLEAALEGAGVEVVYQHGLTETLDRVSSGEHGAAILINPVPISEIRDVAASGRLMPPKSTFFTPKLLTGLVMRDATLS